MSGEGAWQMGSKERREREREEVRNLILNTAREMFAKEGYEAVNMRRIAEKIEYSPTAIYLHFEDKDALVRELCAIDFAAFGSVFAKAASVTDPVERLRRLSEAYVSFALENPNHYQFMFMTKTPEGVRNVNDPRVERGNPNQDAYALLRLTVVDCIKEGKFRPEHKKADLISQALWGSLHGVVSIHITHSKDKMIDWVPPRQTAKLVSELLMKGLCHPPH